MSKKLSREAALRRFNLRYQMDGAEAMSREAWVRWVKSLPRAELNAAYATYGGLDIDDIRTGRNGAPEE